MKSKLAWIITIIFLITICFANAYDITDIKAYYSLEDTALTSLIDNTETYSMSGTGQNYYSITGKKGNAISHNGTITGSSQYNSSIFNIHNNSFSINFWVRHNSTTGLDYILSIKNDTSTSYFNIRFGSLNIIVGTKGSTTGTQELSIPYTNSQAFNMVTVTYNPDSNSMLGYLNAELKSYNTTINDLRTNSNKMYLGIPYLDVIDELGIFDVSLTGYEIAQLYNEGNGFDYNETVSNSNTTNMAGCIDINTYCSNMQYHIINGETIYYCNSQAESQFCSGGCYNNICNITGISECAILGESKCVDSTNYAVCSDSDYDGYLDFGELHTCDLGTYCTDFFHLADCLNVTMNGTHDKYSLIVTPYAVSDENTSYIVNSDTRTVDVQSVFNLHQQQFYTEGTTYVSRTCDYKENSLYSYGQQYLNTSTNFDMSSATNQNTMIRLSFTPEQFASGKISIISQASTSMGIIRYARDATNKSICIYDNLWNDIYCDYDYTGGDTLQNVDLEYTYDFASRTYTISMLFKRTFSQTKIIYPQTFVGNDIYRINIQPLFSSNTTLNSIVIVNIPTFKQFATTQQNTLLVSPCIYTANGLYKVRTYGNNNGMPDYSIYTDYNINIIQLGSTANEVARASGLDKALFGEGLSKNIKYLIVLFTIMSIIAGFTALGFAIKMIQASFIVGSVIATFVLIIFTIFGWISWIVIVMLIIVAIAISILISKTNTNNMENG